MQQKCRLLRPVVNEGNYYLPHIQQDICAPQDCHMCGDTQSHMYHTPYLQNTEWRNVMKCIASWHNYNNTYAMPTAANGQGQQPPSCTLIHNTHVVQQNSLCTYLPKTWVNTKQKEPLKWMTHTHMHKCMKSWLYLHDIYTYMYRVTNVIAEIT